MTDILDPDDELGEAPSTNPDEPEPVPDVATDTVEDDPKTVEWPAGTTLTWTST